MYIPWRVSHHNSEFSQNSHIKVPQVTLYPLENQNKKLSLTVNRGILATFITSKETPESKTSEPRCSKLG